MTLYRIALNKDISFKEQLIVKPEQKSINPRYNAKIQREYEKQVNKEMARKANYDRSIEAAKIIKEINLPYTFSDIKNDFDKNRSIIKCLFQDIFSKYGIVLNEYVLANIFDKLRFPLERQARDAIFFFTEGTHFHFPLRHQFNITTFNSAYGIFSAFFMRAAGYLEPSSNRYVFPPNRSNLTNADNNPFYHEKVVIRILASAMACTY